MLRRRHHNREIGPLLFVCSSGGPLMQLLEAREAWSAFDRVWVTLDEPDTRSRLDGERVVYAYGSTHRNVPSLLRNLALARRVLALVRPSAMVTTGSGVAVPFAWLSRLAGVPVVFVESFTGVDALSLSGRMISPVAERVYVQAVQSLPRPSSRRAAAPSPTGRGRGAALRFRSDDY